MKKMSTARYIRGRLLGSISGINSSEMARESISDDIRRASKSIRVASCTADMSYWDEKIMSELEMKKEKHPDLMIEFLVGPDASNKRLIELQKKGAIRLYKLPKRPPCDCRIIDNRDTYTSNHGDGGRERKYCWTFANAKAFRDRNSHYLKLKSEVA